MWPNIIPDGLGVCIKDPDKEILAQVRNALRRGETLYLWSKRQPVMSDFIPKVTNQPGIPFPIQEMTLDQYMSALDGSHLATRQLAELRSMALAGAKAAQQTIEALKQVTSLQAELASTNQTLANFIKEAGQTQNYSQEIAELNHQLREAGEQIAELTMQRDELLAKEAIGMPIKAVKDAAKAEARTAQKRAYMKDYWARRKEADRQGAINSQSQPPPGQSIT